MSTSDVRHQSRSFARSARGLDRPRTGAPDAPAGWERPAFEVVCLACEISAYAPDEGEPLF